jgi:RNA ligase (TIGR02306 family)
MFMSETIPSEPVASSVIPSRALVTVETVTDVAAIPGADAIVRVRVRGWDVVAKLGEFTAGDLCVYFEIDSFLDISDPRFEFLAARGVRRRADGVRGHVLKTARLRGQYSQGMVLPLTLFPEVAGTVPGTDVTEALGVVKWETPVPASLSGEVRGPRPSWIPMTDEERIQNVPGILAVTDVHWIATEKVDGTSSTYYVDPMEKEIGVCGRNWDLVESETNTLWRVARERHLHERIAAEWPGQRAVLQGEVYGEGIQANPLRLIGQHLAVFTVRVDGEELPRDEWPQWVLEFSVPSRDELTFPGSVEQALADVDRLTSAITPGRPAEGVVWRARDAARVALPDGMEQRASFKVVGNRYLLKHDR